MALTEKKQGEPITVKIELIDSDGETLIDITNDVSELVVYLYTTASDIKKFSKTDRTADNYTQLTANSTTQYQAEISASVSKTLTPGNLKCEIWENSRGKIFDATVYKVTGDNQIKAEV
jgi:hypothetical protein